jgi:anti-sigma factor RsiW
MVKPWFQGRLSFSPPVPDLAKDGFVLLGGRLDIVSGRPAAALVYKRRRHLINVWITPSGSGSRRIESGTVEGFHVVHWQKDNMLYWAASDLNAAELRELAELIRAR